MSHVRLREHCRNGWSDGRWHQHAVCGVRRGVCPQKAPLSFVSPASILTLQEQLHAHEHGSQSAGYILMCAPQACTNRVRTGSMPCVRRHTSERWGEQTGAGSDVCSSDHSESLTRVSSALLRRPSCSFDGVGRSRDTQPPSAAWDSPYKRQALTMLVDAILTRWASVLTLVAVKFVNIKAR